MLGATVAMLAAVGCAEDGVYIEVVADDLTDVELFVVRRGCDSQDTGGAMNPGANCRDGLQPEGFDGKVMGPIFIREQDEGEVWRVRVENGSAWFRFGLDPKFALQRVVVVGYNGASAVKAASLTQIDLDSSRKVIVELDEVVDWQSPTDEPSGKLALKRWGNGRCIGVREGIDAFFIVTEGDADCDGMRGQECDPLAFLVDRPIGTPCLLSELGRCSVGSTACSETMMDPTASNTCLPGMYELDPDVCASCDGDPELYDCIAPVILDGTPKIECSFYYEPEGNDRSCLPGTLGARHPRITRVGFPGFCPSEFGIAAPMRPFDGFALTYTDPAWASVTLERIDGGALDCVKVLWSPVVVDDAQITPEARQLVFWSTGDQVAPAHVIPVDIAFESGCEQQEPTCRLVTP